MHPYECYLTFLWPSPLRPIYIFLSRCDVSIARLFKETFRGRDKDTFSGQCIRLTHIADGDLFRVCFAPCASARWGSYTPPETKNLFINFIVSCSPSRKFEAYAQYKSSCKMSVTSPQRAENRPLIRSPEAAERKRGRRSACPDCPLPSFAPLSKMRGLLTHSQQKRDNDTASLRR